jgi:REP element-mobilizing transposase RayT
MARGNEKQALYKDRKDRIKFLNYLEKATDRYRAVFHCFCLMDNHYHLLLETPAGNLAQIMRSINGAYSSYFNKRHNRVGHVFQGRYKSPLVDADAYCLQLSRYIHLNPVKEGVVKYPWDYEWSSCRDYVGDPSSSEWLKKNFLLSFFGSAGAAEDYRSFLSNCDSDIDGNMNEAHFVCSAILGQQEFVDQVYDEHVRKIGPSRDLPGIDKLQVRSSVRSVIDIVSAELNNDARMTKKMSVYLCHRFGGHSLKEIGDSFGIGESAVSETSNRFAAVLHSDQRLAETVAGVLSVLNL